MREAPDAGSGSGAIVGSGHSTNGQRRELAGIDGSTDGTGNPGGTAQNGTDRQDDDAAGTGTESESRSDAVSHNDDDRTIASDVSLDKATSDPSGHVKDPAADPASVEKYKPSFSAFGAAPKSAGSDDNKTTTTGDANSAIEFFGVGASGSRIVYVIDMSGSMAGYRFNRAREELLNSIWALNRNQFFCVLFFHSEMVAPMGTKLERADSAAKKKTRKQILSVEAFDGTDPTNAIRTAIGLQPDVIYVLSDGEFDAGMAEAVTEMNHQTGIVINTIGFQIDSMSLRQIAEDNRGEYRWVQ